MPGSQDLEVDRCAACIYLLVAAQRSLHFVDIPPVPGVNVHRLAAFSVSTPYCHCRATQIARDVYSRQYIPHDGQPCASE